MIDELSRVPRQEKESVVRVPATSIVTEKARLEWEIVVPARVVRTRSPPFDVARFGCCARERHERALIVTLKLTDAWECPLRRSLCEFVLRIRRIPQLTARTAADGNLSQRRPELSLEGVSKLIIKSLYVFIGVRPANVDALSAHSEIHSGLRYPY